MGVRWRVNCSCISGVNVAANQVSAAPIRNLQRERLALPLEEAQSSVITALSFTEIDVAIALWRTKKSGWWRRRGRRRVCNVILLKHQDLRDDDDKT